MEKKEKTKKVTRAEWTRRADTMFFSLPEEYAEPREFEEEDKLLLARLYIDSFKVLTFLEFTAFQALLIVQSVWDERADAPNDIGAGYFSTHDPVPLTIRLVSNVLGLPDTSKLAAPLISALRKLPILETMVNAGILKELKQWPESWEYTPLDTITNRKLESLGTEIRLGLRRDNVRKMMFEQESPSNPCK